MGRPNKIDQLNLAEKVLCLAATKTSREISAILAQDDKVDISHVAVARYIKGMREERAEQTRALVQEHIRGTVPTDLQTLDELVAELTALFREKNKEGKPAHDLTERLKVARELRQAIDTKLKYSGAGPPVASLPVTLYDFDASNYPD